MATNKEQREYRKRGLIATIAFHIGLLIIFLFTGLTIPLPFPPEEAGLPIELAFGDTDNGSGEEQPMTPVQEVSEPVSEAVPEPAEPVEEVATQAEESPMSAPEPAEATPAEPEPRELDSQLKNALNSAFQSKETNDSKGEGTTDEPGDFGKENGSPTGKSLQGDPNGGGLSYSLGGRGMNPMNVPCSGQEIGDIVVDIIVDRSGKVVRATIGRGTSITNAALMDCVVNTVRKNARFTPKADAPEEQKGTVTISFVP